MSSAFSVSEPLATSFKVTVATVVCGVNLAAAGAVERIRHESRRMGGDESVPYEYLDYSQVPWYRQGHVNNIFVALSRFGCFPLAVITCVSLLTGDVYYDQKGSDGKLRTWSVVNKIWAFLFAIVWSGVFLVWLVTSGRGR